MEPSSLGNLEPSGDNVHASYQEDQLPLSISGRTMVSFALAAVTTASASGHASARDWLAPSLPAYSSSDKDGLDAGLFGLPHGSS